MVMAMASALIEILAAHITKPLAFGFAKELARKLQQDIRPQQFADVERIVLNLEIGIVFFVVQFPYKQVLKRIGVMAVNLFRTTITGNRKSNSTVTFIWAAPAELFT